MTAILILKTALIWLLIACLAVINGLLRENLFAPQFGMTVALPLSGVLLSLIIFLVSWLLLPFIRGDYQGSHNRFLLVGLQWVLMTLAFEFLFGHFVAGKPWGEILQIFDVAGGNLMLLVLASCLVSPYLVSRLR